jgi:hypothetical protein
MSTMGRGADFLSESKRRYEQRLVRKAIRRGQAVDFAISTLSDPTLPAAQASAAALTALTLEYIDD